MSAGTFPLLLPVRACFWNEHITSNVLNRVFRIVHSFKGKNRESCPVLGVARVAAAASSLLPLYLDIVVFVGDGRRDTELYEAVAYFASILLCHRQSVVRFCCAIHICYTYYSSILPWIWW